MDEIVLTSTVSKTNIYYYFKSKEELLAAILDQLIQTYTELMHDIAARSDLHVQERFDLFLQSMTGSETSFLAGCPFLTLYTQMPQEADELRRKVGLFFQDQMHLIEGLLLEGVRKGEFSPTLPTKAVAGAHRLNARRRSISTACESRSGFAGSNPYYFSPYAKVIFLIEIEEAHHFPISHPELTAQLLRQQGL